MKAQVEAIDKVYDAEAQKNPFFAKVLKSQKEFAERAVPHAQKIRPPIEVIVEHYWKNKHADQRRRTLRHSGTGGNRPPVPTYTAWRATLIRPAPGRSVIDHLAASCCLLP